MSGICLPDPLVASITRIDVVWLAVAMHLIEIKKKRNKEQRNEREGYMAIAN